jgi:uncharacterized protein YecE (DUF72 family)
MAESFIGTSGWTYDAWRSGFYAGVPRREWLAHCAEHFNALEINASHYRLQQRSTFERWRSVVPEGFRFALKAHRYLTHVRRLADPTEPIRRERERAEALGDALAAILWQLPARFALDEVRLEGFIEALLTGWPTRRHTIEFRHRSWFRADVAERMARAGIAVCISDAGDWPLWEPVTADFVYVRLHGRPQTYVTPYGTRGLRPWAARIEAWLAEGRDVLVFFDNDGGGAAPADARRLIEMLRGANQSG